MLREKTCVVILCGGRGTRLGSADGELPKPMVRIGRFPLVAHIIKNFARQGYQDFVLACGYKIDSFVTYFSNWASHQSNFVNFSEEDVKLSDINITIAWTGDNTNTGGRVALIKEYIREFDNIIITYGDTLTNCDVRALEYQHRNNSYEVTLVSGFPQSRFGELQVSDSGKVISFKEKPISKIPVAIGIYCVNSQFLERLSLDSILEEEPLRSAVNDGVVNSFEHKGFWMPLDTQREYEKFNDLYDSGNLLWEL